MNFEIVPLYYWGGTLVSAERTVGDKVFVRILTSQPWCKADDTMWVYPDQLKEAGEHLVCPCILRLTRDELKYASEVGTRIMQLAISKKYKADKYGKQSASKRLADNVMGYTAELVVAKALGLDWQPEKEYSKNSPDVGKYIQVRYSYSDKNRLIVRPHDHDSHLFVFVTGKKDKFTIHGCIEGKKAKQEEWLASPNNRPPAYFIPKEKLHYIPVTERTKLYYEYGYTDYSLPGTSS